MPLKRLSRHVRGFFWVGFVGKVGEDSARMDGFLKEAEGIAECSMDSIPVEDERVGVELIPLAEITEMGYYAQPTI